MYGGSVDKPNITCDCPAFKFQRIFCRHCQQVWGGLSPFQKMLVVKHDEVRAKPWYATPKK
jgi:hypothetical protein